MITGLNRYASHLFWGVNILSFLLFFTGIYFEQPIIAAFPLAFVFIYILATDFRIIFFLLLFCIPLSVETELGRHLSTDLPTEPIMWVLMISWIVYVLINKNAADRQFVRHPIMQFLYLHLIWMFIAMIFSTFFLVSFKFFLAKSWYIIVFVFITQLVVKSEKDFRTVFWSMFIPLCFTVAVVICQHYRLNFTFVDVNDSVSPFYRNHVNYAALLSIFFPFTLLAKSWYPEWNYKKAFICFGIILLFAGIFFSYTRGAYLALVVALLSYFIIKKRLLKWALLAGIIAVTGFLTYMIHENTYLEYAPDYQTTIYHDELQDHFKATYQMQDLSTAERFYRWVAAIRMSAEKPFIGYGPGNFYNNYKMFTVTRYMTYVSYNKEHSGVHNYFLMTLVDQGFIGLLIFIALCLAILLKGEQIYHATVDKASKKYIMAIMLSLVILFINNSLSDLIEVDKVGPFFFMFIALLINQDLVNRKLMKPAA